MQLTINEESLSRKGFINISRVKITCTWGRKSESFRLMDKSFFSQRYPLLASRHMDDSEKTWLMVFDTDSGRIWYKDGKSCRTDEIMLMLLAEAGCHQDSLRNFAFNLLRTPFAFDFAFDEDEFLARKSDPFYEIPTSENPETGSWRDVFSYLSWAMEAVFEAYAAEIYRVHKSLNPAINPTFLEFFPRHSNHVTALYPFYLSSVCRSALDLALPYMPIEQFVELISTP